MINIQVIPSNSLLAISSSSHWKTHIIITHNPFLHCTISFFSLFLSSLSSDTLLTMVSLNPEAPEFFPTHTMKLHKKEQPFTCPNFPTSLFTPHSQYYYVVSSFPSRELHPYVYYPTTATLPPPSITTHLTPQYEPFCIHGMKKEPNPVNQKKDEVVVDEDVKCGAKELAQEHVFKPYMSYRTMNGQRSEGTRMKTYLPRKKGEQKGQHKSFDFSSNGKITKHPYEQYCWRGYPKKKRCFPLLPVKVEKNETTVMIRNIPSKYKYVIL